MSDLDPLHRFLLLVGTVSLFVLAAAVGDWVGRLT